MKVTALLAGVILGYFAAEVLWHFLTQPSARITIYYRDDKKTRTAHDCKLSRLGAGLHHAKKHGGGHCSRVGQRGVLPGGRRLGRRILTGMALDKSGQDV